MTKTLKKGLIAVLLLGLCFACAFLGFNTTRAFADLSANEQKFVDDYEAFYSLANTDSEEGLTDAEIRDAMGTAADTYFLTMYMHVNNMGSSTDDAEYVEARTAYDAIIAQYDLNGAALLFSNLTTRAAYIYTKAGYSYKNAAEVAEYRAAFNSMAGADLAFLKNALNWNTTWVDTDADEIKDTPVQLVNAEAKIAQWKAEIDTAIAAIKGIDVLFGGVMVNIYDAGYLADDTYEVVLASEGSIEYARNAVDLVIGNGDLSFVEGTEAAPYDVNHYAYLTGAEEALVAQYAKVTAVEELIDTAFGVYSEEAEAEICYTIYESHIKPAKDAYDALDASVNNNLKSAVNAEKLANLNTMLATYNDVKTAIKGADGVEVKIAAIPAASYTNAFKSKIDAARDAFDALPNDVKEADDGTPGTCVANYQTLLNAEAKWKAYVDEVEAVIEAINELQNVDSADLYAAIIDMYALYNGLSDKTNQLNGDAEHDILGVDATALDEAFKPEGYINSITTCVGAYDYYVAVMGDIATAVNPIKTAIEDIYAIYGEKAKYTNAFEASFNALTAQINALPKVGEELDPRYKGAIDNFAKYETLAADYALLLELANEWADAVDEIGTVSVSNFDAVVAAGKKFKAMVNNYGAGLATDIAAFSKLYVKEDSSKAYSAYYTTYVAAKDKMAEISDKLDELNDDALALVRPVVAEGNNYANFDAAVTSYTAFNTSFNALILKYNALANYDVVEDEETQNYFAVNYPDAYAAILVANIYGIANGIELYIYKIEAKATDDFDYVNDAREEYDAWELEDPEDLKTNYVRNYEVLTDAEEKLNTWQDAVEAILTGAGFDGSDAESISVVAVTKDNVASGFYKLDVDNATALVDAYNAFSHVEQAYVGNEDDDPTVADDYELLIKAIIVAGTNDNVVGAKLYYIDNAIDGYYTAFNNNDSLASYPTLNELKAYVAALDDTQVALLTNTEKLTAVEGSQKMAKDLAAAIDALYADVEEGKVNVVSAIEYYTLAAIYNNLPVAKQDMVNGELAGDYDVEEAFEFIAEKVVDIDVNIADQINAAIIAALDGEGAIEEAVDAAITTALAAYVTNDVLEAYVTSEAFNEAIGAYMTSEAFNEAIEAYLTAEAFDEAIEAYMTSEAFNAAIEAYLTKEAFNVAIANYVTSEAFNAAIANYVTSATFTTEIAKYLKTADFTTEIAKYLKTADFNATIAQYVKASDLNNVITAYLTSAEFNVAKGIIEDKIAAEKTAREAAVADLQAQINALQTKTTVIIIVFAVVCAALCACVIVLFVKKKQA